MAVEATAAPNPIRRVVTLLQEMAEEISESLKKERDLHEKFQCYCKKNDGQLDQKAKLGAALIKRTKAVVKANTALKQQLGEEIEQHKAERKEAEAKLEASIAKRTEEKAKFDEATKEERKTLEDLDKAIVAIEKGMGRGGKKEFLQTAVSTNEAVKVMSELKKKLEDSATLLSNVDVASQQTLLSFLSSSKDYASQSGEIVGILKMIKQNIDDSLGGIISEEEAAVKSFTLLKSSLQELIKTSTSSIEKKQENRGAASVKIVEGKNLISTTEKEMGEAMATLAALKVACEDKGTEFNTRQQDGAAEMDAIHQAIGVLNNDDSLDLFKKTDTKAMLLQRVSLLQKGRGVEELSKVFGGIGTGNPTLALMGFTAGQTLKGMLKSGQAVDFSKIYKMIDDMVALLKAEAADDLASRDSCNESLNTNAASKKETGNKMKSNEASIEDLNAGIAQATSQIEKSTADIAQAKESAAQASKQRFEENGEFIRAVELNKQAVELIAKAKDKLSSYYNPDLVRKDVRVETSEEAAARALSLNQQIPGLPDGQPESWQDGATRKNQAQKGASVLSLMDTLANDLNKDTQALEHNEQTAQSDYEKLTLDLATQQADAAKTRNQAESMRADGESELQTMESTLSMNEEEMANLVKSEADLHASCDFIIAHFDDRALARENEVKGLAKAKAVLAGAKFGM